MRRALRHLTLAVAAVAPAAFGLAGCSDDGGGDGTGPTGASRFSAVSAGAYYTCGVMNTGVGQCWGDNFGGQLGTGSQGYSSTPVPVAGGHRFTAISASGLRHTCGLTTAGAAYCWGQAGLGTGQEAPSLSPAVVAGGQTFTAISVGGGHTCALTAAGSAYCWGGNSSGELGDGTTTSRVSPVQVVGGLTFTSISAGGNHSCAIAAGGAAYCWGANGPNAEGLLGVGTTSGPEECSVDFPCSRVPVAVTGGIAFASISASRQHTCALTATGAAYCWGTNRSGQLGDGTTTDSPSPVRAAPGTTFAALSAGGGDAGDAQTCSLTGTGAALCWGLNTFGQLGNGNTASSATPVAVAGGLAFSAISVGRQHACGITKDGILYCWGGNSNGALGTGSNASFTTVPERVAGQP